MSNSISTLLLRNLSDVFGENDPVCRRAAIDEIFHEDAVFSDPKGGIFRGRDEIDHIAGVIKATHPDFEYQPLFPPGCPKAAKVYPRPSRSRSTVHAIAYGAVSYKEHRLEVCPTA